MSDENSISNATSINKIEKMISLISEPPKIKAGSTPYDIIYTFEGSRLRRYRSANRNPELAPVLFVYALINKPYILDLEEEKSVVEKYLKSGFDVYMIDWNHPSEIDRYTTVSDYVERYIDRMVGKVMENTGKDKVNIFGYCMGGTFSVMYSTLHPEKIKTLTVMAAPISFTENLNSLLHIWPKDGIFPAKKVADVYGVIPPSFFNSAFFLLDPVRNSFTKYMELYDLVDDEKKLHNFLRMESWVNDGMYMAGETYREFLENGYMKNTLVKGEWKINGKKIDLSGISMPAMIIVASKDNLVDPESTKPLYNIIASEDKKLVEYPTGHIGLAVSSKTHSDMWPAIIEWTKARSAVNGSKGEDKRRSKKQR